MPHQIIEYSANLDDRFDIQALLDHMHQAALDTDIFPMGGLRTRAARRDHYRIADGHPDNGFVNVWLRVGPRPAEVRKQASEVLFAALTEFLGPVYESSPLAISFEIQQLEPDRLKQGNLRQYMAQRGTGDGK